MVVFDFDSCFVFVLFFVDFFMMTFINDFYIVDFLNLVKGERFMRCKISSVYRFLDFYGWV